MSIEELFGAEITDEVKRLIRNRLTEDGNLFDSKKHSLKNGVSSETARLVLLMASKLSTECGRKLHLTADEARLMNGVWDLTHSHG
jgi:hypothetical protein